MAIDPSENWLAAGCGDGSVGVYHLASRLMTCRMAAPAAVTSLSFNSGDLIAAGLKAELSFFSIKGQLLRSVSAGPRNIYSVSVNTNVACKVRPLTSRVFRVRYVDAFTLFLSPLPFPSSLPLSATL